MPQKKGCIPWNKGKHGLQTAWNKGKKCEQFSGKNNAMWNGGKCVRSDGYIEIYAPQHPRVKSLKCKKTRNYVFEHIIVAEKKIGRYLMSNEVVHHINGIHNDNRPDNLVVLTRADHIREHKPSKLINKWSHNYGNLCLKCKTNQKKHHSKGLCRNCYNKKFRPSRTNSI